MRYWLIIILSLILSCEQNKSAFAYTHAHRYKHASTKYKPYSIKIPKSWGYGNPKPQHYVPINVD